MWWQFPKFAVLAHILLLTGYLSWARGGAARLDIYLPLLWLVPGLLEMALLFPPMRRQESVFEARRRAQRQRWSDPLFHLGVALLLFLLLQAANGPRLLRYDNAQGLWLLAQAPLSWLPSSINRSDALQGLFWFGSAWGGIMAVRHGLSRKAKLLLLDLLATSSALLAAFGLIQYGSGTQEMYWILPMKAPFFATFSYPNHAGALFAMMTFVAGGNLIAAYAKQIGKKTLWRLTAVWLLNLLGATFSLSYGALLLSWIGTLLGLIYALAILMPHLNTPKRLRLFLSIMLLGGIFVFLHLVAYPHNAVHQRTAELFSGEWRSGGWQEERTVLRRAAFALWRAHPVAGVGTWGFRGAAGLHIEGNDWELLRGSEPQTCHNDYLQFLCELGAIGTLMLLTAVVLLLKPAVTKAWKILHEQPVAGVARPPLLQRLPPLAVAVSVALLGIALIAIWDLPFRNPVILLSWSLLLAALPDLLSKVQPHQPKPGGERRTA